LVTNLPSGRETRAYEEVLKSPIAWLFLSALIALWPALKRAQQYLYTNDSIQYNSGNHTVTTYKTSSKSVVTMIKSYRTGGLGSDGRGSCFASIDIASAKRATNQYIFASDAYSDDVAGFTANTANLAMSLHKRPRRVFP
jgi:hypothetical protein